MCLKRLLHFFFFLYLRLFPQRTTSKPCCPAEQHTNGLEKNANETLGKQLGSLRFSLWLYHYQLGETPEPIGAGLIMFSALFLFYSFQDYCASKFGAIGFHESLSHEIKASEKDGINMTLVCPYLVNTGMFKGCRIR